jgi:hypothetical protein
MLSVSCGRFTARVAEKIHQSLQRRPALPTAWMVEKVSCEGWRRPIVENGDKASRGKLRRHIVERRLKQAHALDRGPDCESASGCNRALLRARAASSVRGAPRDRRTPNLSSRLRTISLTRAVERPKSFTALVKLFCSSTATKAFISARLGPRIAAHFLEWQDSPSRPARAETTRTRLTRAPHRLRLSSAHPGS